MRTHLLLLGLFVGIGCSSGGDSGSSTPDGGAGPNAATPSTPTGTVTGGGPGADGGVMTIPNPDGGAPIVVEPARPYVDFDVNHVLITGQSNSVANGGKPVLSTSQPYGNLMFDTGVMPMKGAIDKDTGTVYPNNNCDGAGCVVYETPSSLVPLVEGDSFFYPVETSASGMANEISFLATGIYQGKIPGLPNHHDILASLHGRSGNTYWCLRKGGCPYKPGYNPPFTQAMQEVTSGMTLAMAAGKSYVVRAVMAIHGESDHYSYTAGLQEFPQVGSDGTPGKIATYADALLEWQSDYETSVTAITHQTQPIPMFVSQLSGWNDATYSKVAQFQLDAHVRAPGKVILIGPAYNLELGQDDCLHYTSAGERHLGEYFAKAYARVVLEGKTWEPLRPQTVTRTGATITVKYFVPVPPIAIDTEKVAAVANYGFTYSDSSGATPAITKVEVSGPDTVTITLASAPTGTDGHLMYAQNQVVKSCIGTPNGARGNLRDSDATPSRNGSPLQNWGVHFDVAVP